MSASLKISEFVERAKSGGVADQVLVGMLTGRGWPEKEVHEALAAHYERLTGMGDPSSQHRGYGGQRCLFLSAHIRHASNLDHRRGFARLHFDRSVAGGYLGGRYLSVRQLRDSRVPGLDHRGV